MILAVDAGNSRTKWGLFDAGGALLRHGALDNGELARLSWEWGELVGVRRAVISSVAGEAVSGELHRICDALQLATHWVSPRAEAGGVRNGYAQPQQLGTDRWAALIAAWNQCHAPCVVVNAGTALTVDALSGEGIFLGGLIVPGLALMRASLHQGTAAVGAMPGQWRDFPVATADAVHSGALAAMAGAVQHMLRQLAVREGRPPLCLLGGGDAQALAAVLDGPVQLAPHLVLQGLFLLECASA